MVKIEKPVIQEENAHGSPIPDPHLVLDQVADAALKLVHLHLQITDALAAKEATFSDFRCCVSTLVDLRTNLIELASQHILPELSCIETIADRIQEVERVLHLHIEHCLGECAQLGVTDPYLFHQMLSARAPEHQAYIRAISVRAFLRAHTHSHLQNLMNDMQGLLSEAMSLTEGGISREEISIDCPAVVSNSFLAWGRKQVQYAKDNYYQSQDPALHLAVEDCVEMVGAGLYHLRHLENAATLYLKALSLNQRGLDSATLAELNAPACQMEDGLPRDSLEEAISMLSRELGFFAGSQEEDVQALGIRLIESIEAAHQRAIRKVRRQVERISTQTDLDHYHIRTQTFGAVATNPKPTTQAYITKSYSLSELSEGEREVLLSEMEGISAPTPHDALDSKVRSNGFIGREHNNAEAFLKVLSHQGAKLITTRSEHGKLLGFSICLLGEIPNYWRSLHERYQNGLRRGIAHYVSIAPEFRGRNVYQELAHEAHFLSSGVVDVMDGQVQIGPVPSERALRAHMERYYLPVGDIRRIERKVTHESGKEQIIASAVQDMMLIVAPGMRSVASLLLETVGAAPTFIASHQIREAQALLDENSPGAESSRPSWYEILGSADSTQSQIHRNSAPIGLSFHELIPYLRPTEQR